MADWCRPCNSLYLLHHATLTDYDTATFRSTGGCSSSELQSLDCPLGRVLGSGHPSGVLCHAGTDLLSEHQTRFERATCTLATCRSKPAELLVRAYRLVF